MFRLNLDNQHNCRRNWSGTPMTVRRLLIDRRESYGTVFRSPVNIHWKYMSLWCQSFLFAGCPRRIWISPSGWRYKRKTSRLPGHTRSRPAIRKHVGGYRETSHRSIQEERTCCGAERAYRGEWHEASGCPEEIWPWQQLQCHSSRVPGGGGCECPVFSCEQTIYLGFFSVNQPRWLSG